MPGGGTYMPGAGDEITRMAAAATALLGV